MKNKNQRFKFGVLAFVVLYFNLSFSSAINFKLNDELLKNLWNTLAENIMYVHFADNWNDFGWFLYFSNGSGDDVNEYNEFQVGTTDTSNYGCRLQMKWFYYNAERWERLWPLDEKTSASWNMDKNGLLMSWWIYTSCVALGYSNALNECRMKDVISNRLCIETLKINYRADGYGYYGSLEHEYSWQKFNLTVGVGYTGISSQGFISIESGSKLSPTFVRINNKYPVWFLYDYNGWVWLVWCRFTDTCPLTGGSMKNLIQEIKDGNNNYNLLSVFGLNSTDDGIEYSWSLWIDCNVISTEDTLVKIIIEWIVWMDENDYGETTKFWWLGNASDTKMQYFGTKSVSNSALMNYVNKQAELLCRWKWNDNFPENINSLGNIVCVKNGPVNSWQTMTIKNKGKTLILKDWNATIQSFGDSTDKKYYDVYLLSGNLIIDETNASNFVFTTWWFISSTSVLSFSWAVYANSGNYNAWDAVVWSFIRWNFIVNWYVTGMNNEKLKNKYFIYGKFTTKDTISSLESIFSWRCNNWVGSDGNYCPKFNGNPYWNAVLVVIDQNYGSPILNS